MRDVILSKLKEIEERENVRIIHCAESGSRAWGFASPDSDYDVRFIYVRRKEFYLQLNKTRDVIEWQLDETLDINGWDVKKALVLLRSSNPTLFEWDLSPIVYKTTDEWSKISKIAKEYFDRKAGLYHYLSTAKSNYSKFGDDDTVKLKLYFYILRPLLACKWILAEGTPPPVPFSSLVEKYLHSEIKPDVEKLLDMKKNTPEIGKGKRFPAIDNYIEENIKSIEKTTATLANKEYMGWDELNNVFLSLVE